MCPRGAEATCLFEAVHADLHPYNSPRLLPHHLQLYSSRHLRVLTRSIRLVSTSVLFASPKLLTFEIRASQSYSRLDLTTNSLPRGSDICESYIASLQ